MKPILELIRLEENYDYGTFGILRISKEVFCVTLEPRDELNAVSKSSIPAQQYICQRGKTNLSSILSLNLTETFEVMNVPNRTVVKFHPGNSAENTEGCILLGQYFGKLKDKRAILNSGNTFKSFMELMTGHDTLHLTVIEHY